MSTEPTSSDTERGWYNHSLLAWAIASIGILIVALLAFAAFDQPPFDNDGDTQVDGDQDDEMQVLDEGSMDSNGISLEDLDGKVDDLIEKALVQGSSLEEIRGLLAKIVENQNGASVDKIVSALSLELKGLIASLSPPPTDSGQTQAQTSSGVCRLDKISTINEVAGAGPQRIEVSGHGGQHVDYYPDRGVKSVSYIVWRILPPEVPAVWHGFGSIWEGNGPECEAFDYVADATAYAQARVDSGHSGLVFDLRDGKFDMVANVANLSESEIKALLALHRAGMTQESLAQSAGTCGRATSQPLGIGNHQISGPAVINVWTNRASPPPWGQAEVTFVLPVGVSVKLLEAGGTVSQFLPSCTTADLQSEMASNGLPQKTVEELQANGLIQ